jgi:UDP-3-O-[3-hydroxymyristoyl] N-acetylglucosamine deacetylase
MLSSLSPFASNAHESPVFGAHQRTLKAPLALSGIGLHSGKTVQMQILPAPASTGIVFQRTDVTADAAEVPASYALVSETMLGTVIQNAHGTKVQTIEHLMAALWGAGVDNAVVLLDAPEVPIMDGSSKAFVDALARVGVVAQRTVRDYIEVRKPIRIVEGESEAVLLPHAGFVLDVVVEYPHPAIARQMLRTDFAREAFGETLGYARTFGFEADVTHLRKLGLCLGGSLENAIVLGADGILNAEPLRAADEFVRHKMLDCVGDFFLAGGRVLGHVVTKRPGHRVNNMLLRALFADATAWRLLPGDQIKLRPASAKTAETAAAMSADGAHSGVIA